MDPSREINVNCSTHSRRGNKLNRPLTRAQASFFTTRNFLRKDLLHEMFGILKMGKFNFVQFVANV